MKVRQKETWKEGSLKQLSWLPIQLPKLFRNGASFYEVAGFLHSTFHDLFPAGTCILYYLNEKGEFVAAHPAKGLAEAKSQHPLHKNALDPGVEAEWKQKLFVLWTDHPVLLSKGFQTCWSFPVYNDSHVLVGIFDVYFEDQKTIEPGDQELLQQMAGIAGEVLAWRTWLPQTNAHYTGTGGSTSPNFTTDSFVSSDFSNVKGSLLSPQQIIEAIPQIAWTNRPDGKVIYFNQRWYDYTGYTEDESLDDGWQKTLHADDLPRTLDYWHFSLQNGEAFESQYRIKRHSDGEYRWHLVRATPIIDQGKIELWVGTCTDIHEQIMSLVKLAEAQHQLRLINQELSDKNKELVKINNDLDNFIYTASHDLKSPILNLEGLVYALSKELLAGGELVTDILSMIEVSLSRFKNTIKDLTEISKIQKNLEDEQEIVKLKEIFRDVRVGIQDMIDFSGARIQTDFQVPVIKFSRKNFRSILYNLVSNAIKYRSPERALTIKLKSCLVEENKVLITVSDTGLGMNLSHKDQIFSMFKRLHNHVEGSGVGLYIVKRIIENAGGTIEVESEVGVGSVFKIYLPYSPLTNEVIE